MGGFVIVHKSNAGRAFDIELIYNLWYDVYTIIRN